MVPVVALRGPRELRDVAVPPEFEYLDNPSIAHRVNIHHPAYQRRHDLLLSLFAWDAAGGGLCYSLVHNACAIIANNQHHGWLTSSQTGPRLSYEPDALLPAGDYWYHLPHPDEHEPEEEQEQFRDAPPSTHHPYRWPMVTCFQDWEFPDTLPLPWATVAQRHAPADAGRSSISTTIVRSRDLSCRITKHVTGTEVAHLCPEQEREWFRANVMYQYNSNTNLVYTNLLNDASNLLLLRSDLHKAFDARLFCLYPKGNEFAVHVMEPTIDIGPLYHNIRTHPIDGCRSEFLYARFAWSIFPALSGFLSDPSTTRSVIVVKKIAGESVRQVEEQDSDTIQAAHTKSRSRSPNKRARPVLDALEADGGDLTTRKRHLVDFPAKTDDTGANPPSYTFHQPVSNSLQSFPHESPLPSLEDDLELACENGNRVETGDGGLGEDNDDNYYQQLRDDYLHNQRPAGFAAPSTNDVSIFQGAKDLREILERAGVEIREDNVGLENETS